MGDFPMSGGTSGANCGVIRTNHHDRTKEHGMSLTAHPYIFLAEQQWKQ
jgi:hypothetical protein